MKNLLFLSVACLLLVSVSIISFCTTAKDADVSPYKEEFDKKIIENLVAEYNKQLFKKYGNNTPFIEKGFLSGGSLESAQIKENGQLFQAFLFTEFDENGNVIKKTKFDFGLDNAVEIPKKIKNAQVAFIGNQLIIIDLEDNYQNNLFVKYREDIVNKTPAIHTIEGAYLGIEAVSDLESRDILGTCSCECVRCPPPPGDCGDESCSCTCSGAGCSKTCRTGYNAICRPSGACQ